MYRGNDVYELEQKHLQFLKSTQGVTVLERKHLTQQHIYMVTRE